MNLAVTSVHLDLGAGRRGTDMCPSAIYVAGLLPGLARLGHAVRRISHISVPRAEELESGDTSARYLPEVAAACRELALRVEQQVEDGLFPVVLGGDHSQAIGTISGLARALRRRGQKLGVVWVDAHTDMNTPDITPSGNIHGMPLAVLLGHGPRELVEIAGDEPALDARNVVVIGARDVDPREAEFVRRLGLRVYTMTEIDTRGLATCAQEAFERTTTGTAGVHLSFDMDGVDPDYAPGVGTPVAGGLTLREAHLICEYAHLTQALMGVEVVEVNPTCDHENRTGKLASELVQSALGRLTLPTGRAARL